MPYVVKDVIDCIKGMRLDLTNEKRTQEDMHERLQKAGFLFTREFRLDHGNIPDFYHEGLVIELKVKGQKMSIYRQCERYCCFPEVKELILCTNKAMGFPSVINGKHCHYINIGQAFL